MQCISFLGIKLDSVMMTAHLWQDHAVLVMKCSRALKYKILVPLKHFQRLLGHMASSAMVTQLGLMHMRPLQHSASFSSSELGMAPRHTLCEHHSAVSSYFQSLGVHLFSSGRSALGTGVQVHRCYNRYFRNRLGRCVHWACGLLGLDKPSTALSYNVP